MDGWMDGWISGFVCVPPSGPSSATAIQSIYTDQFLFLCARVTNATWLWAWDIVCESSPNWLFSRAALFFQFCILLLLIQSKNPNGRGVSRASASQIEKYISMMVHHKWDFYQNKNWIFFFPPPRQSLHKSNLLFCGGVLVLQKKKSA